MPVAIFIAKIYEIPSTNIPANEYFYKKKP